MSQDALGQLKHLKTARARWPFPDEQDNDPKHTSKIVKAWFVENDVDLLDWPPNSPDLSIIENLWDHLDRRIRTRNPLPHSAEEHFKRSGLLLIRVSLTDYTNRSQIEYMQCTRHMVVIQSITFICGCATLLQYKVFGDRANLAIAKFGDCSKLSWLQLQSRG